MRKPTLSPTRISIYLACPTKYNWTYRDPRGRWYLRAKSYYSFGSTLHKVLQRFHDNNDQGVTTVHQALAALEESWIEAGYTSAQEMQEALGEGKSILQAYVEKVTLQPITAKVLYIEKLLRLDMGPFILMGRVDRVDEHEDGTLEIIDYKSGRLEVTPEDVQCDLAMGCYQLLLKSMHPEANVIGTIIALRSGNQASYAMSTKELEEFRNDILAIGTEIIHRDFEHHVPVWKDICPECDFLSLCKKHPEFVIPSEDQTTPTET